MNRTAVALALAASFLAGACAGPRPAVPMTASELSQRPGIAALLAYLGQPDADPGVCGSAGARLRSPDLPGDLTAALVGGTVSPEVWSPCVALLVPALDRPQAAALADSITRSAAAILRETGKGPTTRARRVEALARVYLERAPGVGASDQAAAALEDALRGASGPDLVRAGSSLRVGLELERGRWKDRLVDAASLDDMASEVGVVLLLRAARRLPDPALRTHAERLVVRQRIAASPFPEVAAASVESVVLRGGVNPISLREHPALRVSIAPEAFPSRTVVVRQQPLHGAATLLGRAAGHPTPSVLPPIPLRGALQAQLAGVSRAVTVCAPGRALDPTPCIAPSDVIAGSALAQIRDGGDLRLAEQVTQDAAVDLARQGSRLRVPLSVGSVAAGVLEWPVLFEPPPALVLRGERAGERGPSLTATVERLDAALLVYVVEGTGHRDSAVVPVGQARSFRIVSRGAPGADGSRGVDGLDGARGLDGSSASCPILVGSDGARGGDGTAGGNGSDGARGGDGGDVRVVVVASAWREETLDLARTTVTSEGGRGGRGGPGGRGGRGGPGGQGGPGATCADTDGRTWSLGGGQSGEPGASGPDGMSGSNGENGRSGEVHLEVRAGAPSP